MSHFQVSRDLDESLSSLSRLGWVRKEEESKVPVWIVFTQTYLICWESRHVYTPIICMVHLFLVFLHILFWWNSLKSKEPKVCVQERKRQREREEKQRKNKVFYYHRRSGLLWFTDLQKKIEKRKSFREYKGQSFRCGMEGRGTRCWGIRME